MSLNCPFAFRFANILFLPVSIISHLLLLRFAIDSSAKAPWCRRGSNLILASSDFAAQCLDAICIRAVRAFRKQATGRTSWLGVRPTPSASGRNAAIVVRAGILERGIRGPRVGCHWFPERQERSARHASARQRSLLLLRGSSPNDWVGTPPGRQLAALGALRFRPRSGGKYVSTIMATMGGQALVGHREWSNVARAAERAVACHVGQKW